MPPASIFKTFFIGVCLLLSTTIIIPTSGQSTVSNDTTPTPTNQQETTTVEAKTLPTTTTTAAPKIDVTADVCSLSLITSEDGTKREQKCTCTNIDVDCRYLGITELPKLISFPKSYHIANFEGNKISNLNADTFYNGKDILQLDLSHNEIDFVSVVAFKGFSKLRNLDLSHNRLWNLPPNAFSGLAELTRLDLSYNDLITVLPKLFAPLTHLRELLLESNPLQELEPKHFEHLTKLEHLDLESTLLRVIPDHLFVFTPNLKFLDLSGNLLTEVPTEAFRVLDHVKTLELSANPIEVIGPEAFRGMKGLIILYLDRMPRLVQILKYAFGDAIQLQELHCSYAFQLEEIDANAFVRKVDNRKVPLAQLFLRQNDLRSVPRSLLNWNEDVELHLRDNPLHCDCHTEWMVNIKLKNNFQTHARCSSPGHFEGIFLSDLKGHEVKCGMQLAEIVMIACAVVTAILIMVMIVAFLKWRKNYRGYSKPYYVPRDTQINDDVDYKCGDDGM